MKHFRCHPTISVFSGAVAMDPGQNCHQGIAVNKAHDKWRPALLAATATQGRCGYAKTPGPVRDFWTVTIRRGPGLKEQEKPERCRFYYKRMMYAGEEI
jgi:hypothetical protein